MKMEEAKQMSNPADRIMAGIIAGNGSPDGAYTR
jgi:hypothetical protein